MRKIEKIINLTDKEWKQIGFTPCESIKKVILSDGDERITCINNPPMQVGDWWYEDVPPKRPERNDDSAREELKKILEGAPKFEGNTFERDGSIYTCKKCGYSSGVEKYIQYGISSYIIPGRMDCPECKKKYENELTDYQEHICKEYASDIQILRENGMFEIDNIEGQYRALLKYLKTGRNIGDFLDLFSE